MPPIRVAQAIGAISFGSAKPSRLIASPAHAGNDEGEQRA